MENKKILFGYLSGIMTCILISLGFCLILIIKVGYGKVKNEVVSTYNIVIGAQPEILNLPLNIIEELTHLNADISNSNIKINVESKEKLLTQPDSLLGYTLRKSVGLDVYMLDFLNYPNFDPPVIHINQNDNLSNELIWTLKDNTLLKYQYTTNEKGHRTTLPKVSSKNKILVIGDSVTFGVGVDDSNTVVSKLQQIFGSSIEFINAGVGGYSGEQVIKNADIESKKNKYSCVVYIACFNDFKSLEDADRTLKSLKDINNRFNKNVIVLLHTYMEYNLRKFIHLPYGNYWSSVANPLADSLRVRVPKICRKYNFEYLDLSSLIKEYIEDQKTVFSPFNLYVDHCHFSPSGNLLVANSISKIIKSQQL